MPQLPFLPGIIRTRLLWSDTNGHFGSRFFIEGGVGPYAQADLVYLAGQISTLWGANMKAQTANSYSLVEVDCLDLTNNVGVTGTWQGSVAGTNGVNEMPSSVCTNIRSIIPQHYRGGHPVMHHPPGSQTVVAGPRNWTGAYCSATAVAWAAVDAGIRAISHGSVTAVAPCVLLGYIPGASAGQVTPQQPLSYLCPTKFGTLRRRLYTEN